MINKSLLALKECLRGLHTQQHTGAKQKMPFRDSSITRLLEEVLVPKRGKDSDTVMLVNCAQPAQLEKKTVNSLRYGQLYATTTSGGGAGRGGKPRPAKAGAGAKGGPASCDPAVLAALREVYAQHVPEKSAADVDAIIAKFGGREAELLGKVRAKYCA